MNRERSTDAKNCYEALARSGLQPTALAGLPPSLESFNAMSAYVSFTTWILYVVVPKLMPPMALWRERFFIWMLRNAQSATGFFRIPTNRVVELGTLVEI
jgi:KUP system potassium uptake protein